MVLERDAYKRRYDHVQRQVRKYPPSELIPALAAFAADPEGDLSRERILGRRPWAVAALAKESIIRSNEYRSAALPPGIVTQLIGAFDWAMEIREPFRGTAHLLVPVLFEQIRYQDVGREGLARTLALFVDTPLPPAAGPDVAAWDDLLGMSLADMVKATFVLWVLVNRNGGIYDSEAWDKPEMQSVLDHYPRTILELTAQRLTATVEEAKEDYRQSPQLPRHMERYAYNPLTRTPLIDLGDRGIVAPQPALILMSATPESLFYLGAKEWDKDFLTQLGHRFEAYVGRQLRSVSAFEVHSEVVYTHRRSEAKSVDWIVVSAEAVILIECKARRAILSARAGGDELAKHYVDKLDEGRKQINRTVERIEEGHESFAFVPRDRPIIGLIVTAEPFYGANDPEFTRHMRDAKVPIQVASVSDLEEFLCLPDARIAPKLLEVVQDDEMFAWTLSSTLAGEELGRNSVLDDAWDRLNLAPSDEVTAGE
ncbi:nuclease-related domain-containing protein [Rhodococcus jostii]|uniref:nuclease-related domain-containing protein n=1 Tax=Rhodococcus jostii TaxID=132919 RepID=UPI00365C58A0